MTDRPKKREKVTTMVTRVGQSVMEWPTLYINKIFKNVYLEFVWTIF